MQKHRNRSFAMASSLLSVLVAVPASGHEFWIQPSTFHREAGGTVGVRVCIGDGFEAWPMGRNNRRIETFTDSGPDGRRPVVGLDGADPAGAVRVDAVGTHVIAYGSNRAFTEMPAAEFEQYLAEKGLEQVAAQRARQGTGRGKVREAYSRHAKTLIRLGTQSDEVVDHAVGLRLELVAGEGLTGAPLRESRSFQLLYESKPLAGVLVVAFRPGTADDELKVRTGADGRARFNLPSAGLWRIAAVHMIPAAAGIAAEWESLWASLTFELPAPAAKTPARAAAPRDLACRNRAGAPVLQARQ